MGDHQLCHPSQEGAQPVSYFSTPEYDELWQEAEQKTSLLLDLIQPSEHSEESRKAVINYVQTVIERELDCKIFSFGSVPLKTYLPDGDIDLTAISRHRGLNDDWAKLVSTVLEHDEHINKSEFHVKEVKCISAEVPVVKCLVENIIVDITFNQLGGLSTLCFLEEVDTLINRDHLFKRSIILIKAWCFYESRILGAHHGLLSTYALEVLVLYIFHIFHHSLRGPLEVLFRFLQYFSKFDWEQNCLSLWGPVPVVPSLTEGSSQSCNASFLLSEEFLKECREKYSSVAETNHAKAFSPKFMNLMDPLRPFNNLGRSVNSGNLVRIYRAFTLGASQLERLLQGPKEHVSESLASFFRNTHKHCQEQCLDAGVRTLRDESPPLCHGNINEEATSDVVALSNGLTDVVSLKSEDADGASDKPACGDTVCPNLQGHDGLGSADNFPTLETRDTDAVSILKGDHATYFKNLKDGLLYQNCGNSVRARVLNSRGSIWEGLGRPLFFDGFPPGPSPRKNVPFHGGGLHCSPNNSLLEAFPKHTKGTGTFFPHVKPTVERDRRIYANGVNRQQRNMDSFQTFNHNTSEAFRSRSRMPKRREGTNKTKFRKNTDLKTADKQQNLLTEDNVVRSPTMETMETTEHSLLCQGDGEPFADHRLMDCSPRSLDSAISSSSAVSKDLPLEKLEFGSFGPGFLTKGFQTEQVDSVSPKQLPSPRATIIESRAQASKAGDKAGYQKMSAYQLKDEDFPPLSGANHHQEPPGTVAAERNASGSHGWHHQARHLNRSPEELCPLSGSNHQELPGTVPAERNASASQRLHALHLNRSPKATKVAQIR